MGAHQVFERGRPRCGLPLHLLPQPGRRRHWMELGVGHEVAKLGT